MRAGPKSAKSSLLPDLSKQHLSIKKNSCEKFELKKMRGVRYLLLMSNLPLKYVSKRNYTNPRVCKGMFYTTKITEFPQPSPLLSLCNNKK